MICDNIQTIKEQIRAAALKSGRDPESVNIVAVSKRMDIDKIRQAAQCGQNLFGENYLQEAAEKITQLDKNLTWHFIGHLQSNKAKTAAELFQMVETVDRLKIARALDKHAGQLDKYLDILVQVNIGREQQKSGVAPEETEQLLRAIKELPNLRVLGLMAMAPYSPAPEASRPYFKQMRALVEQLKNKGLFYDEKSVRLSMGMSGDFTVAIEEGATHVRIGTAIFGERTAR